MKKILLILLFAFTLNAQVRYVWSGASGSNNGTSWTNAWTSLGAISWATLSAGDSIYISGGSGDSLIYSMYTSLEASPNISFATPVVLAPSWEDAHNGKVVFTNSSNNQLHILRVRGISGLKITGFTFMDLRSPTIDINGLVLIGDRANTTYPNTNRIHVDNCHIISNGSAGLFNFEGSEMTLSNSYLEVTTNNSPNECDPLTANAGGGFLLIEGNTIIQRNTSSATDAHRDMLQLARFHEGTSIDIIIRNNVIVQLSEAAVSWNALIYSSISYVDTTKWYIYNNILVSNVEGSSVGGFFIYNSDGASSQNHWMFNNIMIHSDPGDGSSRPMSIGRNYYTDTIFSQNNLIIVDEPINIFLAFPLFYFKEYYREVDYNGYFEYGGLSDPFMNGNGFGLYGYSTWQAAFGGNDVNSITGNSTAVNFDNKFGITAKDYYTTTGRGVGVNVSTAYPSLLAKFPDIMYDILGNPRPETGAWDIGALQFQTGTVDTIPSFSFTALTDRELDTEYISSSAFDNADSTFSVWTTTAASFKINYGGSYSTAQKTADMDDTVYVKNQSSVSNSTKTTETIVAGGYSRNFDVTTKAAEGNALLRASDGKLILQPGGRRIYLR